MKTVAQKIGIKENSEAYFMNAPKDAVASISLPSIELGDRLSSEFDYIHLFVKQQSEQERIFPKLKAHLKLDCKSRHLRHAPKRYGQFKKDNSKLLMKIEQKRREQMIISNL